MTQVKDSSQTTGKNLSCCSKFLIKNGDNAVKLCVCILILMCLALIITTIYLPNSQTKLFSPQQLYPDEGMEQRIIESKTDGCQLLNCTVDCWNTSKLYEDIFEALQNSPCEKQITLSISNQLFPHLVLANKWIPTKKHVKEIIIANGNFTRIRNEAFNTVDFTKVEVLMLLRIDVSTLYNGILLGLSTLRSLEIMGKVNLIHRCFFQPVQSSLLHLKIGAELEIFGNENIFGISHLPNLETLDLSDNTILGSLSQHFFRHVLNLKYLVLSNAKIMSIDENAFDDVADNLQLLDLSNNLLTTIGDKSFEKILGLGTVNVYLLGNNWYCNCDLKPLINLYLKYEARFGDKPYCKGPPTFYGAPFINVTFNTCNPKIEDGQIPDPPMMSITQTSPLTVNTTTEISVTSAQEEVDQRAPFQMKCLSAANVADISDSSSIELLDDFFFEPPCHEFEVVLLPNNSVEVLVEDPDKPINIIWFSDELENFVFTINGVTIDYNCEEYTEPYLIIDNLEDNYTYTFCVVPNGVYSISPFNCLPLHVPIMKIIGNNIWISSDDKQFTVGIVCLIFTCSMLLGGVVAYFGIKAYPDLLEGSKHVLVVKKSNQTCYVSTITEKNQTGNQKSSFKEKDSFKKLPLPVTPQLSSISRLPPLHNDYEESTNEPEDHYELPCIYNKTHDCQVHCINNKNVMTPMSPPPLPKRNSDLLLYCSGPETKPEELNLERNF